VAAELRHGLEVLWPSELADQYYCEYKVHLKHTHPEVEVESPALEVGTAGHEGLASVAQPISRAEIAEAIRTGKRLALCEWTLEGEVEQVRLRGRPDYLAFEGTNAELVLEFKFARFQRPFRSQEVQAAVYGLLAEKMGFSCEGLCYGIVRLPPQPRGGPRDFAERKEALLRQLNERGTLFDIHARCAEGRRRLLASGLQRLILEGEGWTAFLYRYDRAKAEADVSWTLKYWRGERGPLPETRMARKCFACPFNAAGLCEYALDRPDPLFRVTRSPEGTLTVVREHGGAQPVR